MKKAYICPVGKFINLEAESMIADSIVVDDTPQNNLKGESRRKRFAAWDVFSEDEIVGHF